MSNKSKAAAMAAKMAALPQMPKELINQFITGPMSAESIEATSVAFKKALIEQALAGELTHHLGYEPGADKPEVCAGTVEKAHEHPRSRSTGANTFAASSCRFKNYFSKGRHASFCSGLKTHQ